LDISQIQQVFINVILNAEYFMYKTHGSGLLDIKTKCVGDRVRVSIKDNGPGIEPQCLSHMFDPFYSTKESGQGTGLGLSISYGIIEEHGGNIFAKSKPGHGATFFIELPVSSTAQ
jgi:signal transduction histidine kinase